MYQVILDQTKHIFFILAISVNIFNKPTLETRGDFIVEICLYFIGSSIGASWKYITNKRSRKKLSSWDIISELFVSYSLAFVVNYYLLVHQTGYDRFIIVLLASFISIDLLKYILLGFPKLLNGLLSKMTNVDMNQEDSSIDNKDFPPTNEP